MLDGHRAAADRAIEVADRQRRVVQEQIPAVLELDDAGMDREAVLARSGQLAAMGPGTGDLRRGRVGDPLVAVLALLAVKPTGLFGTVSADVR